MANVTITQLPAAGPITGTESVPIVQNGQTVQTTTAAIAASPSQFQTFLTLNNEPSLPASRYLSTGTGLGLSDGGAQSDLEIILNGASGSLEAAGNGVIVKTGGTTVAARTISTSGAGLTISNGNGVSGNPTIALSGLAASLANMGGTGVLGVVGGSSITSFVISGTPNQITVANGAGPGNPTISITTDPILPGTGAVTIPKGTTAQRPGGVDGMIRFNTETSAYETFDTTGGWSTLPSGAVTQINTGTGLTGGPITSSGTISIANTTVAAGTYGAAGAVGRFTVNAQGQLTDAQSIPIAINPSQINPGILPPGVTVPLAQASINIDGGLAGEIPVQTAPNTTSFIAAPTVANTFLEWDGSDFVWTTNPVGTVTSVNVSGESTGLVFTDGPITTSGTILLGGVLNAVHGGTGFNNYTNGQLLIGSSISGNLGRATLTGTTNRLIVTNGDSSITLDVDATSANTADKVVARDGSGNFSAGTITASLSGNATTATTSTNLAGGAAGSIPYQTASGITAMLATSSGVLVGGTTPSYSTSPSLTGTNFTSIPNAALDNSAVTIGTTSISLGSSSLTLGGLTSVTVTQNPSNALDLATKQYVDGLVVSGIHYHAPVRVESPTPLTATYNNGVSGVGATLTNSGAQAALVIDGVTLSLNDRVLIYTQTNATENGIYYVSDIGSGSTNWELTRATDADTYGLASPNTLGEGSTVFVQEGATGAGELYTCNTVGVITFGTTNITFVQILSAQIYSAGAGLTLSGTQFSVATNGVTDTMLRQSAGLSVIGRSTNSTGNVADITAASDYQVLRRSGTSIGFGAIDLSQSGAVTGTLPTGNGGTGLATYTAGDIVYYAAGTSLTALAIGATNRILTSSGTAPEWSDPANITVGTASNITVTDNTSSSSTYYPVISLNTTGSNAPTTSSTKLSFVPSTGVLSATGFSGALNGTVGATTPNAGTFTTLTANTVSEFGRSSANYWQAIGAATTLTPEFATLGSDTNIPVTFRSKGTGAVNLAPGSSGVNISNGGTITAITVTANGSSYTSIPSVAISAPTTTNGVQATADTLMFTSAATVASGGTGYTNGDVLTIVGGSRIGGAVGAYTVTGVSGGVITSVSRTSGSGYSELPTNPVSTTGGTGSGATLNIIWVVSGLNITNAGSGYVEQPTVTFSGGGGSGAAAYATVGAQNTIRSLFGTLSFNTPAGESFRIFNSSAFNTTTDFIEVRGGSSVSGAYIGIGGSTTNANLYASSKGTGNLIFFTNAWNQEQFRVAHTASAVNYVQVTGAATGVQPIISSQGSDANIGMTIRSKGTFACEFQSSAGTVLFQALPVASSVNFCRVAPAVAGSAPVLSSQGSDTNIDLALTPKGTGRVTTAAAIVATGGISGGTF